MQRHGVPVVVEMVVLEKDEDGRVVVLETEKHSLTWF